MTNNTQTIPRLCLQPLAVDFIDNHLPKFHPAFAHINSRYNLKRDSNLDYFIPSNYISLIERLSQQAMYQSSTMTRTSQTDIISPQEIERSIEFWDSVFLVSMRELEERFYEPKGRHESGYSIRGLRNWEHVYDQLDRCYKNYMDDTGLKKKATKGWREFTDRIGPVREALRLVPNIDYLTPVRGTLEFIMDAIRRASEARHQILHGLDNLDSIFKDIELYLVLFSTYQNVQDAGTALVLSALVAVEKLIGFYLKSKGKKAWQALFKGEEYETDVIGSLQDIAEKSKNLRSEAEKADMLRSTANWKEAEQRDKKLIDLQGVIMKNQRKLMQKQDSITTYNEKNNKALYNGMRNLMDDLERSIKEKLLRDFEQKFLEVSGTIQRVLPPDPFPRNEWHVTPDDIWDIFCSFYSDDTDMQYISRRQEGIPIKERVVTESIITNPHFREWMVSPTSKKILIQGNLTSNRQISSQSIFCSTFIQALRENSRFIPLFYFCGLHSNFEDPYSGPRGMMMSFIAQLVLYWDFDTTEAYRAMYFLWDEHRDEPNIKELCLLAWLLVVQIPLDMTVFCIIDGINVYEKEGYVQDLVRGLACILDWTIDPRVNATIKILVTSPCRTLEVREGFDDDAILFMAESDQLGVIGEANQRLLQHRMSRAFRDDES